MSSPAPSKAQQSRDFRQEVTDSIIRMLEQGVAPWQKPWEGAGSTESHHRPSLSRRQCAPPDGHGYPREFDDPRWLTYRQAAAQGWQVRQGEKMGVKVKMVTGDQLAIAQETAMKLGMGTAILDAGGLGDVKHHESAQSASPSKKPTVLPRYSPNTSSISWTCCSSAATLSA